MLPDQLRDRKPREFPAQRGKPHRARAVADKYVYVTAGACGACRFGQYHQSYELALRNLGLDSFRMFLIEQNKFDQGRCTAAAWSSPCR